VPELSLTGQRWRMPAVDPDRVHAVAHAHRLPILAARCLLRRAPESRAAAWLAPGLEHLHDPGAMRGMDVATARLRAAVAAGHRVRIVTDYDVDGTTSSLILQTCLRLLGAGATVDYHIPDRFDEGYGFSKRAAARAVADGVQLVVTADIGVRDGEAVSIAAAGGVDVIVCDHHLPDGHAVPADAHAVLCPPQQGCDYPNRALAACGVSLKLAQALLADHPRRDALLRSMLKIAAIGTVADVVDLATPENRAIVALGLAELRRGPHSPGLQALLDVAGLPQGPRDASDIAFRLGPRINAAGRLETADLVVRLLDTRDPDEARALAAQLDQLNAERQQIQATLQRRCLEALPDPVPPFVVLWGEEAEGWHRGVVGIAAAKVRDRLHRPAAIAAVSGPDARGSVRSIPGVHAVAALDSARDLLLAHGGHPVAAGFSIRAADLPALAERLAAYVAANAGPDALVPELELDGDCPPAAVDPALIAALGRLGPFGKGNPEPLLRVEGRVEAVAPLGDRHLRLRVDGLDAVWWGGAEHRAALGGRMALAARAELNTWRGQTSPRLSVVDAGPPTLGRGPS
jgi:single-stranded-DNA-specific exonuclease